MKDFTNAEKWRMFKNFMHNELGVSKENIRDWTGEAVKEVVESMVDNYRKEVDIDKVFRDTVMSVIKEPDAWSGRTGLRSDIASMVAKTFEEKVIIKIKD